MQLQGARDTSPLLLPRLQDELPLRFAPLEQSRLRERTLQSRPMRQLLLVSTEEFLHHLKQPRLLWRPAPTRGTVYKRMEGYALNPTCGCMSGLQVGFGAICAKLQANGKRFALGGS